MTTEIKTDIGDEVPRTCANCACHNMMPDAYDAKEEQMFCRRDPPMAQRMRLDRQVVRNDLKVMMKDGKTPLMETVEQTVYMYRPTLGTLTCFDGWRPMGTAPGARSVDERHWDGLKRLYRDMILDRDLEALRGLPEDFSDTPDKLG